MQVVVSAPKSSQDPELRCGTFGANAGVTHVSSPSFSLLLVLSARSGPIVVVATTGKAIAGRAGCRGLRREVPIGSWWVATGPVGLPKLTFIHVWS